MTFALFHRLSSIAFYVIQELYVQKKFLSTNLSVKAAVCYSEKYKLYSSLVKKYDVFFTIDNITFIYFRYAMRYTLKSLLGIK